MRTTLILALAATALLATSVNVSAQDPLASPDVIEEAVAEVERTLREGPNEVAKEASRIVGEVTGHGPGEGGGGDDADGDGAGGDGVAAPGLSAGLMAALVGPFGLAFLGLAGLGTFAGGMALMARYVDPKEALGNPQRAMLFGFIKGNPGVHLKQLSDDFDMKTSTVLWHIRKLEAAELVRSQKVNGFRVFYPVAGGIAAKELGGAVAALANDNAVRILEFVSACPGSDQRAIADVLDINPGTARWHLRKLRDRGILREITEGRSSSYHPTQLGTKALLQARGLEQAVVPPARDLIAAATAE